MDKNILYSIITPVYNREDCILRCMESVERAMHLFKRGKIEHVIVDDGSSDETCRIVEEYATRHSHIRFISFPKNRGTNAARNAAISAARGEWCIILDSDDYFVDNALAIIAETMKANSGYKHYMFTPDDMQPYFQKNEVIRGAKEKVLLYPDFLNGYIGGDFVHVCNTAIMQKFPFNETIRIYEGIFFLMFYREAKQMMFTNKIVTIRERNRVDSISKEFLRTNDDIINHIILSNRILLQNFEDDMMKLGMVRRLNAIKISLCENLLLMAQYNEATNLMKSVKGSMPYRKFLLFKLIAIFHGGILYKKFIQIFLNIKYNLLKRNLQ